MQESKRNQIISFIENKNIKKENIKEVLEQTTVTPPTKEWYLFIDQVVLWFGALSLAFALMFFMAYNWSEFGHMGKFALVEGLMVLTVGLYAYLGVEKLSAKVMIMVSAILLGILLALVGQTYQTGADPWQLFFYWAVLMLPWVIVGRFSALWMLWIFLINLSLFLYMLTFRGIWGIYFQSEISVLWVFFIFNTLALLLWEIFSCKFEWLNRSWAIRVLGFVSGTAVTWLALSFIWDDSSPMAVLVWMAWLGAIYWVYRVKKIDLFMLSMGCLSFSTVIVSFLINIISWRHFEVGAIFFIGVVIIGLGAGSASWLKSVQKEEHHAE
jgi:uncharacterized membrane protein